MKWDIVSVISNYSCIACLLVEWIFFFCVFIFLTTCECVYCCRHVTYLVKSFEEMRENFMELLMRKTKSSSWYPEFHSIFILISFFSALHWAYIDRPERLSLHRHRRFDVLPWFSWLLRCNPRVTMSFVSGECSMRESSVLQSMTRREFWNWKNLLLFKIQN